MSSNPKEAPEKGVMLIKDEKTGREYRVAVGPVQRIEWLVQLQNSGVSHATIALALAIVRFINRKQGHTFAGDKEIGKLAGIEERMVRLHIANLIAGGHLVRIRRGPVPSALFLVIKDRQSHCRSIDDQDRQSHCRSTDTMTGNEMTNDRQSHDTMTGNGRFGNHSNTVPYSRITQRINSGNKLREERAREKDESKNLPCAVSKRKKTAHEIAERFEQFWQAWPNKVGKPAARKAFDKCWREIDAIILGVERYVANMPPGRAWLNPSTFLNQRRWEDEPAPAPRPVSKAANVGLGILARWDRMERERQAQATPILELVAIDAMPEPVAEPPKPEPLIPEPEPEPVEDEDEGSWEDEIEAMKLDARERKAKAEAKPQPPPMPELIPLDDREGNLEW